jgi:hypothetical protein
MPQGNYAFEQTEWIKDYIERRHGILYEEVVILFHN